MIKRNLLLSWICCNETYISCVNKLHFLGKNAYRKYLWPWSELKDINYLSSLFMVFVASVLFFSFLSIELKQLMIFKWNKDIRIIIIVWNISFLFLSVFVKIDIYCCNFCCSARILPFLICPPVTFIVNNQLMQKSSQLFSINPFR